MHIYLADVLAEPALFEALRTNLRHGPARKAAALTIKRLSSTHETRAKIGEMGLIGPLVRMIRHAGNHAVPIHVVLGYLIILIA